MVEQTSCVSHVTTRWELVFNVCSYAYICCWGLSLLVFKHNRWDGNFANQLFVWQRYLSYLTIGVGRGGGQGGPGPPPIIWEGGGQHTLWPPNNPPTCTGKTIPLNSILEFSIISYFKMRNVIIWHWFIKNLVGTWRRNDVDATSLRRIDVVTTSCACWELGPPPWPPQYYKPSYAYVNLREQLKVEQVSWGSQISLAKIRGLPLLIVRWTISYRDRVCSIFSGSGKFCLGQVLDQLTRDVKSEVKTLNSRGDFTYALPRKTPNDVLEKVIIRRKM